MQRKYVIDNSRTPRAFMRALAVLLMAAWPLTHANAQDAIYSADRVKAAFIYHFSTYVNWPEPVAANGEFTIAVLGADDIATELEQFLPGHTIQSRTMSVRRLRSVDELGSEEVLFVGADRNSRLPEYLEEVKSRPILVVTDLPDGLHQGAMINFRIVDSRVRFEISQRAAESVGLELSSRLLAAAMFVDTSGAIVDISSNAVATRSDNAVNR
ncbi:MAG: YfiR family protein [Woeseiaceae bacterium]